jgi:hypothetical protein
VNEVQKTLQQALGQNCTNYTREWRIAVQYARLNMPPAATL